MTGSTVSLFQAATGQEGDVERRQIVVACLSPTGSPHTDTDMGAKGSGYLYMYGHPAQTKPRRCVDGCA